VRAQIIGVLEAQEIKETDNEEELCVLNNIKGEEPPRK
jgi:hypothetical protein